MIGQHAARPQRLSDDFLAELRGRVNLFDIAVEYTDLKPGGAARYKGLCPFHSENTPSFIVSTDTNRYHCFGCGADGDAISLLTELGGLTFREAVDDLAGRVGLTVPTAGDDGGDDPRIPLRRALNACQPLLHNWLMDDADASAARQFLADRSFTREHAELWELGFQPRSHHLARHMPDRVRPADLLDAGMTADGHSGAYDVFRGRLLWPLRDATGQIIGYAGRDLDGTSRAKYINTRETALYRKQETLFGLHLARRSMLAKKQVFLVEGYTDVMAMVAAGIENTVATCGTAVTPAHAEHLGSRIGDGGEVVTVFDNDDAGRAAAWKAFLAAQSFTSRITHVHLDGAGAKGDPCDVRQHHGDEALRDLADARTPLLGSILRADIERCDTGTPEGKTAARDAVVQRLRQVRDPVLAREYVPLAADWIGIRPSDFGAVAGTSAPARQAPAQPAPPRPATRSHTPTESTVTVAATLMHRPIFIEAATWFGGGTLAGLLGGKLAEVVENSIALFPDGRPEPGTEDAELWAATLLDLFDDSYTSTITVATMTDPCEPDELEAMMGRLARESARTRLVALQAQLDTADDDSLTDLLAQFQEAKRHLKALSAS